MLPIIGFPDVVGEFAGAAPGTSSGGFKQYLSGLTGRKPAVLSIASRLFEPVDQSSLNRFLTLYEWDEELLKRRMTIKKFGKTVSRKAFREVRVLDKTYWVHTQVLDVNKLGKPGSPSATTIKT